MNVTSKRLSKKEMVQSILNRQSSKNLSTREVISQVKETFNVVVSNRSVQRIKKKIFQERHRDRMMKNDVFDTGSSEKDEKIINLNGLSDDDIIILNLANEGGWSVDQIANAVRKDDGGRFTVKEVRKTLIRLKDLVQGEVLDEDNPDVYLTTGAKEILEELDALPGGEDIPSAISKQFSVEKDFWEVKQDCVKECSKVEGEIEVFMNMASRRKAMLFMKWAGAREWLAYLLGEVKDEKYYITDMYLPDQRTSSALVDNINNAEFNKLPIVGVIHSHHEMGAGDANNPSFSGHDDSFINSNHNLSLLAGRDSASKGFKIVGIARTKTPCGAFIRVKANIKSMVEDPDGDKVLKTEFLEKTQTQTHTYNYNEGGFNPHGYGLYPRPQIVRPTVVVDSDGEVLKPDADGIVRTRSQGFHFSSKHLNHGG